MGWLTAIACHPWKALPSWDPGFAQTDLRGFPSLLQCEVGIGVAGGRGLG